jgi:hypothetical protein
MAGIFRVAFILLVVGPMTRAAGATPIPEELIKKCIDRGVEALRRTQSDDGSFVSGMYGSGATSLAALTLLECGVSGEDEQVRKAVAFVREDCPTMNRVYNVSLAIMLLDRLGDPNDLPLIQFMAVRLLEGQRPEGGWHYTTPEVSTDEADRVRELLRHRATLKTSPEGGAKSTRGDLDPYLIERLKRLQQRQTGSSGFDVDNSNTQFAVLATWVARRNGVPVDGALRRADIYFRSTHYQGLWGYEPNRPPEDRAANTCSGLLGIAAGAGVLREVRLKAGPDKDAKPRALPDPLKDLLVQGALTYVGRNLADMAITDGSASNNWNLYFLWSIERVGMIYSVPKMGGVDWYEVGAALILRGQKPDGSWPPSKIVAAPITSEVNTCFALLFLRKSNFAHDLTGLLKKQDQRVLHSRGEKNDEKPVEANESSNADRLAKELAAAKADRQAEIIDHLRDGKGAEFTAALARVIAQLSGSVQQKARDALAERMARMTAATIRVKLKDESAEIRRASALACAMKDDKTLIPDLITVLDDPNPWVVRATAVALRSLTGQDFGPSASASPEERTKAVAAWKDWWARTGRR